jgi:nitroreductase
VVVEEKSNMTASFGAWVKDKNFAHLDVGIAAAHIVLAAEDEGLGSCIIGWFDEEKVRQLLHVPKGKRILLDIVVGYSTQPDRIKKRKDPKEMISYNQY